MAPGTVGWSSVLRHQCLIANSRIQGDCDTIQAHSPTDQPDNKSNDHIFKRGLIWLKQLNGIAMVNVGMNHSHWHCMNIQRSH